MSKMVHKIYVAVFLLSLLAHQSSALYPHQQRSFLGRGLPPKLQARVSDPPYTVGHVTQNVDHFNEDTRTFSQRYLALDKYWDKKGPLFVYTGNEGDIVWFFQNSVSPMRMVVALNLTLSPSPFCFTLSPTLSNSPLSPECKYYLVGELPNNNCTRLKLPRIRTSHIHCIKI